MCERDQIERDRETGTEREGQKERGCDTDREGGREGERERGREGDIFREREREREREIVPERRWRSGLKNTHTRIHWQSQITNFSRFVYNVQSMT